MGSAPGVLTEADVDGVAAALTAPGALCYVHLYTTNEGLGVDLSFNPVSIDTDNGSLTVSLRAATLSFSSKAFGSGSAWSKDFLEVVSAIVDTTELSMGSQTSSGAKSTNKLMGRLVGKLGISPISLTSTLQQDLSTEDSWQRSLSENAKRSRNVNVMELHRNDGRFTIEFGSEARDDLCALNAHLVRRSLLDLDEPASVKLDEVVTTFRIGATRFGEHALHIREVSGAWSVLNASPMKRTFLELLIPKVLSNQLAQDRKLSEPADE